MRLRFELAGTCEAVPELEFEAECEVVPRGFSFMALEEDGASVGRPSSLQVCVKSGLLTMRAGAKVRPSPRPRTGVC